MSIVSKKIETFLNIHNHIRPKEVFDPSRSINNTQLIRLHPEEKANIEKIYRELPEFLFDFEKYKDINFNGKPFEGKAGKTVFNFWSDRNRGRTDEVLYL